MFKPGKGVRFTVDRDIAPFLEDRMGELNNAVYNHVHEEENAIEYLALNHGWDEESDVYGDKATSSIELDNDNQLRISLVVNARGTLKVDIREWYVVDES